jgi:Leucine-rich repeat (LRR) protein
MIKNPLKKADELFGEEVRRREELDAGIVEKEVKIIKIPEGEFSGQEIYESNYNALLEILNETDTKLIEVKKTDHGNSHIRYFGIKISDYNIINMQIQDYGLTKVPEGINKLKKLRRVDLNENKISEIKELYKLGELQRLDLFSNKIDSLNGIGRLKHLDTLIVNYNKIVDVSPLENVPSLTYIGLYNNPLSKESEKALIRLGKFTNYFNS